MRTFDKRPYSTVVDSCFYETNTYFFFFFGSPNNLFCTVSFLMSGHVGIEPFRFPDHVTFPCHIAMTTKSRSSHGVGCTGLAASSRHLVILSSTSPPSSFTLITNRSSHFLERSTLGPPGSSANSQYASPREGSPIRVASPNSLPVTGLSSGIPSPV